MESHDERIDAYIQKSAEFARPILMHLRKVMHKALPDVEETVKWGMPFFEYMGPLCNMAAFKQHCAFGFWKGSLMKDSEELKTKNEKAMGHLGKITSLNDLPEDKRIIAWIKEAARLNEEGVKVPERTKKEKKHIEMPDDFQKALTKNKKAREHYQQFSPSHKYEYLEWITGAKTEATRQKRIDTTIEQLSSNKSLNWKYGRK